jgi:hypothetical protein
VIRLINAPPYFYLTAAAISIISAIIIFTVGFFCYRAYKLTKDKKYLFFTAGFSLLSLGAIIGGLTHFMISLSSNFGRAIRMYDTGYFVYIFISLLAYSVLLSIYKKNKKYLIYTLAGIVFLIILVTNSAMVFNLTSFLIMAYATFLVYKQYKKGKSKNVLKVMYAFSLFSIQHLLFMLNEASRIFFILGHLALIIASIIFLTLILGNNKNDKSKK